MIRTARLILRTPGRGDREALTAILSDPLVMADLFPGQDRAGAEASLARHDGYRGEGLGFLAVERREDGAIIGFCGLKPGAPNSPIAGLVEAGWIFGRHGWGQGYAQEAMAAVIDDAWGRIHADRIVAITSAVNEKSQKLMARLGMHRLADGDYLTTLFPDGHRLQPTVTFAIQRPADRRRA